MPELTDADIAEGLRLARFGGNDFAAHSRRHYAAALRELRRLRAVAAEAEGLRQALEQAGVGLAACAKIFESKGAASLRQGVLAALARYDAAKEKDRA